MPELVVMEGKCQPIQLEPFVHQVGGQSSILKFDDTTICKPLIAREHHFYEAMPPELKEFTPQYRGVIEVTFHEDSDGFMTLAALPPKCKVRGGVGMVDSPGSSPSSSGEGAQSDSDSESLPNPRTRQRFRMRQSGTIEMHGEDEKTFEVQDPKLCKEDPATASLNPWSLRCHREQLAKMRSGKSNGVHKFILLENLASHFRMPCILDLKMGTRQHGDDAGEEKRKRQEKKCQKTTSHSLGLRLCGMQVYQSDTGHYMCHNKYFGRKLSAEGVQDTLLEFLNNGTRVRTGLIDSIIAKLRKLHEVVSKQDTFRFYSSSLLIMYDGWEVENADSPSQIQGQQMQPGTSSDQQQQQQQQQQGEAASSAGQNSNSNGASEATNSTHDGSQAGNTNFMHWETAQSEQHQHKVDVRMIDFAHSTHEGFRGDRTLHSGPDKGYLFGLESLIRMFENLKSSVYT